jgi:hypothetical protein
MNKTLPVEKEITIKCCNNQELIIYENEYVCNFCGEILKKTVNKYEEFDKKKNNIVSIKLHNNNKSKNIYIADCIPYKTLKIQTLLNFLKQKNNKSPERIHENILEQTVKEYVDKTKNKIYRSNKRSECLAWLLYNTSIKFNNPKTITFIINYMDLSKGGFSRGIKALASVSNILEPNMTNTITLQSEDKLIILKNYLEKLLTLTQKQINNKKNSENIFINNNETTNLKKNNKKKNKENSPTQIKGNGDGNVSTTSLTPHFEIYKKMTIKILNFTNKIGFFNEFRTITKIIGSVWIVLKECRLKYNNLVFKQIKVEKNTIKNFYKKVFESNYYQYYKLIIDSYSVQLTN